MKQLKRNKKFQFSLTFFMDVDDKLPRGYLNTKEVDSRYGRRWIKRGESKFPALYSRIGEQLRNPKLHRTICRWVIGTPNWVKLITDPYRKRWPLYRGLNAAFFAEFALKPFAKRTISETCHTLPFYGVGGKFWRGPSPHNGNYFKLRSVEYQIRPWKAEMRGDMYFGNIAVRKDVAPLGKSIGKWNFEPPAGGSKLYYRPAFPERTQPYTP
jgi:hypothetical protein